MKKRRIILQCAALALAVAVFFGYRIYRSSQRDSDGPEFTVDSATLEISILDEQSAMLQGGTARDPQDGDVTDSILIENVYGVTAEHMVTVTYAAFDSAGNVSKTQRQVRFTDYQSPRFTLDTSPSFPASSSINLMDYVGAEDLLDGDIRRRVRAMLTDNSGKLNEVGTHQVLLQVSNSLGDIVRLEIPVEIYPVGQYNAQLALRQYLLYLPQGTAFDPEDYLEDFSYAGRKVSLTGGVPGSLALAVAGSVDSETPGVYPISYTVTATEGTTEYAGYARLIVIIE